MRRLTTVSGIRSPDRGGANNRSQAYIDTNYNN